MGNNSNHRSFSHRVRNEGTDPYNAISDFEFCHSGGVVIRLPFSRTLNPCLCAKCGEFEYSPWQKQKMKPISVLGFLPPNFHIRSCCASSSSSLKSVSRMCCLNVETRAPASPRKFSSVGLVGVSGFILV